MRPSHLHVMVQAPDYHKLIASLYPEDDDYVTSDAVFEVKKLLIAVRVAFLRRLSSFHDPRRLNRI